MFNQLLPVGATSPTRAIAYAPLPTAVSPFPTHPRPPRDRSCWSPSRVAEEAWFAGTLLVDVAGLALLLPTRAAAGELTRTRSRVLVGALAALTLGVAGWRIATLHREAVRVAVGDVQRMRRYSGIMSIYALGVLALSMVYTLIATIDPQSIDPTDVDADPLAVLFESVFDLTLVASGTGFARRVPVTAPSMVVAFLTAAVVGVYLTLTVFATMLSSEALYRRPQARNSVGVV